MKPLIIVFGSQQAYLFRDYWEDIGTIKSFFDANLALTEQVNHLFFTLKVKI
jgi:glucose-1-phosphate adenylyltransferase